MAANSMCPVVWIDPPGTFLVACCLWFLGGLDFQLAIEGCNFPLQMYDCPLQCCHNGFLGGHVIGVFRQLHRQAHVGASEVSHFCSVIRYSLCKTREIFLYSNQVVGSIAALAQGLLPVLEFCLHLNETGMEGRP